MRSRLRLAARLRPARGAVVSAGSVRAVARGVFEEWRGSRALEPLWAWLEHGAPSDEAAA